MRKLRIAWSKREKDFMIHYPRSCDGSFISQLIKPWKLIHPSTLINASWTDGGYSKVDYYEGHLGRYSLLEMDWLKELDRRGYDLKTLKFEIKTKDESNDEF